MLKNVMKSIEVCLEGSIKFYFSIFFNFDVKIAFYYLCLLV